MDIKGLLTIWKKPMFWICLILTACAVAGIGAFVTTHQHERPLWDDHGPWVEKKEVFRWSELDAENYAVVNAMIQKYPAVRDKARTLFEDGELTYEDRDELKEIVAGIEEAERKRLYEEKMQISAQQQAAVLDTEKGKLKALLQSEQPQGSEGQAAIERVKRAYAEVEKELWKTAYLSPWKSRHKVEFKPDGVELYLCEGGGAFRVTVFSVEELENRDFRKVN